MILKKLVFPNGEHAQTLLKPGLNRIGAASDCEVAIMAPSMPLLAAEIRVAGPAITLLPNADAEVQVNGTRVREPIALRAGDRLEIAGVKASVVYLALSEPADATAAGADAAATRMMVAAPRYSLRGVSGEHFGKSYALAGTLVIGRAPECDIVLALPEISRKHAQLRATPGGVWIEDLGSINGVWVNGNRVQKGLFQPGDELRLDTSRFLISTPGGDLNIDRPSAAASAPKRMKLDWPVIAMLSAAAIGVVAMIALAF
jgi:FHA domain